MAKKKPCNCEQKEFIYYQIKVKDMMHATQCAQHNAEKGIRTYIQAVNDDSLMITASDIKKAKPYIVELGKENVAVMGGIPHCVPTPGHPCPKD